MTRKVERTTAHTLLWTVCVLGLIVMGCQSKKTESKEGEGNQATAESASNGSSAASGDSKESGDDAESRAKAAAIADRVIEGLGGENAWHETRYLSWVFFGGREYWWDKKTDDVRIETNDAVVLLNLRSGEGRAKKAGEELKDPTHLRSFLNLAKGWWENDYYWMFLPFVLRDDGVNLTYKGEGTTNSDVPCDIITVTFDEGYRERSKAKYDVYVSKEDATVLQWSHYPRRELEKPQFTLPWGGWQQFGKIRLATEHGQGKDWKIAAPQTLPESVFQSFDPVVS